jgi:hypothetical protein
MHDPVEQSTTVSNDADVILHLEQDALKFVSGEFADRCKRSNSCRSHLHLMRGTTAPRLCLNRICEASLPTAGKINAYGMVRGSDSAASGGCAIPPSNVPSSNSNQSRSARK